MSTNNLNDAIWKYWQKHLRYTDDEIELFKKDPRWEKIMSRAGRLLNKTIIFEVIESHNCNIEHNVGDKFYFAPEGYMLAHKGPKKVCPFIMTAMARIVFVIEERIYEGLDPLPLFYRAHCDDVGFECGGWGQILIETKIVDRS